MDDISDLVCRERLIPLEENACYSVDLQLNEEIIVLGKNQTITHTSIVSDRRVVSTESEFRNVTEPLDVVTELS